MRSAVNHKRYILLIPLILLLVAAPVARVSAANYTWFHTKTLTINYVNANINATIPISLTNVTKIVIINNLTGSGHTYLNIFGESEYVYPLLSVEHVGNRMISIRVESSRYHINTTMLTAIYADGRVTFDFGYSTTYTQTLSDVDTIHFETLAQYTGGDITIKIYTGTESPANTINIFIPVIVTLAMFGMVLGLVKKLGGT